ncbi:helix-turn-helix transcriptional regulator [Clostridium botulinum]|uniref:helix-turn-helix transcriptional regulator n=1 Tax=Clostridium botulinum TaxID=1491 RepID=UPI000A17712C|nr:helix-turn-helix transcriptional regulator [Clostridium botulinum]OSA69852.1 transcriptional regulator [Clostridium botulinum]OSA82678.1 transcriptional regulator [Clostridium botulinum]
MKNKLKKLRLQFGLTQGELAQKLKVARPTISNIEREIYTPSGSLMIRIAIFFGKPAEQIFFEDSVMQEEQKII